MPTSHHGAVRFNHNRLVSDYAASSSRLAAQGEQSFAYRAAQLDGTVVRGVLRADNSERAHRLISERGLFPIELHVNGARLPHIGRRRMPVAQLAFGLRIVADFLDAGLPIARALGTLSELAPPVWSAVLPEIQRSVREGESFSSAMAGASIDVPSVVLAMLAAGESGGGMGAATRRAADLMEETASVQAAIRSALAYPLVLAAAGSVSLLVLVGVVIPRFAAILGELGQSLPASTSFLLDVTRVARHLWIPVLVSLCAAVAASRLWLRTEAGVRTWDAFLLRLPLVGPIREASAMSRWCAAMGALLENGVSVARAMSAAGQTTGDQALLVRLAAARMSVIHGSRLSRAAEQHGALSPTVVRLVRAAEEHGKLAASLNHAGKLERERATRRTQSIVRLLEPTLILIFGGVVALVAAALLQAVYSVRPAT